MTGQYGEIPTWSIKPGGNDDPPYGKSIKENREFLLSLTDLMDIIDRKSLNTIK